MDTKDEIIKHLQETISRLEKRILELERRLGLNSDNSSKPPGSDGFKKSNRPPLSSRGQGKRKGGQPGHKGNTLKQTQFPDKVIVSELKTCPVCEGDLTQTEVERLLKRQVIDIEIRQYTTEYQAQVKRCCCGACVTGPFPDFVKAPVQIGPQLMSIGTYLSNQFIAKDRLSEVMENVFGVCVSDTTLLKHENSLAKRLSAFYSQALDYLKQAKLKHSDETGIRVGKKTQWMHVLSNEFVTYLKHKPKRKIEYEDLTGILVHDHYKSYLNIEGVEHAFCNAHILRELKALIEYEKEPWAKEMHALLKQMCHEKNTLNESAKQKLYDRYDVIIESGLAYHEKLPALEKTGKRGRQKKRIGHNLLIRLMDYKTGTLRFLADQEVPFTNNQAEQDLRMIKVKQKVSGCFRTIEGAKSFAILRSYIGTAKKNGFNILDAIKKAFETQVSLSDFLPAAYPN